MKALMKKTAILTAVCAVLFFPRVLSAAGVTETAAAPGREDPLTPFMLSEFFDMTEEEPFFSYSPTAGHYGYEEEYTPVCGVWCAVSEWSGSVYASSTLAPQGRFSYEAAHLIENDRSCCWVEGALGYGIGEYVELTREYSVSDTAYGADHTGVCIVNGYAQTAEKWAANTRVRELELTFNGEYVTTLLLHDIMEPQFFDLTPFGLHSASGEEGVFRFTVRSVYPGERWADTAITGIEFALWTPNH